MMIRYLFVLLTILFFRISAVADNQKIEIPLAKLPALTFEEDWRNACITSSDQKFGDSNGVIFAENLVVENFNSSSYRYEILNDKLKISKKGEDEVDIIYFANLDPTKSPIDVVLQFILFDESIGVLWRETYINRSFRFGIVLIDGHETKEFCNGVWGVDTRD